MSGVEIVAAASLASTIVGSVNAADIAQDTADTQQRNIREQSVQYRLQANEATIARQKKLERVIAAEQVSTGIRGISPQSGSVRALSMENFSNFLADENASSLSLASKQLALHRQGDLVESNRKSKIFNIGLNAATEAGKTAYSYSNIPSKATVDNSKYKPQDNAGTAMNKNLTDFFNKTF